ncbi:hypothetical protein PDIDSM_4989 [Penicillium digitatum]|nr:hypothetical protein PDIDSM_4989 [Penicillium digitatum]
MTADSESDDSEAEDDWSSQANLKRASKSHRRSSKQKPTKKPHKYRDDSTEERADESSSAEVNVCALRASNGRVKRKRLVEPSGLADTWDKNRDMKEEGNSKLHPRLGITKRPETPNELADSADKDLVGGAMDGLTLDGDAPKTNGSGAGWTKIELLDS